MTEDYKPLEGEDLARHLGFGDGLRMSIGRGPIDLERPVCLQYNDAYFEGLESGQVSGGNFVFGKTALRPPDNLMQSAKEPPTLWDRMKNMLGRGA